MEASDASIFSMAAVSSTFFVRLENTTYTTSIRGLLGTDRVTTRERLVLAIEGDWSDRKNRFRVDGQRELGEMPGILAGKHG